MHFLCDDEFVAPPSEYLASARLYIHVIPHPDTLTCPEYNCSKHVDELSGTWWHSVVCSLLLHRREPIRLSNFAPAHTHKTWREKKSFRSRFIQLNWQQQTVNDDAMHEKQYVSEFSEASYCRGKRNEMDEYERTKKVCSRWWATKRTVKWWLNSLSGVVQCNFINSHGRSERTENRAKKKKTNSPAPTTNTRWSVAEPTATTSAATAGATARKWTKCGWGRGRKAKCQNAIITCSSGIGSKCCWLL